MTKEEIIDNLKYQNKKHYGGQSRTLIEAIKLIEQPTSDDCVSRQAVLDKAELIELEDGQMFYCIDPEDVKALPPVTPTHCIAAVRFSKEDLKNICDERIEIECTHGTCKDCKNFCCLNGIMPTCKKYFRRVTEDFYCADFEKRVNENG